MIKKRIMSLVLAFTLVMSLLPVSAAAEDLGFGEAIDPSGVTWSVEVNGADDYGNSTYTLTISGSGAMEDYVFDESTRSYNIPWAEYAYDVTQVVISDGVTSIGANAFGHMYSLEKVTMGKDVASISDGVFAECASSLTAIEVSAENTAFCVQDNVLFNEDQSKLILYLDSEARTSYSIPGTVKMIGCYAFSTAYNLTSVSLPDGLQTIEDYAFEYDYEITAVDIPDTVTEIGKGAFYHAGLTSIKLPDGGTTIGEEAFYGTGLTSVTIPDGVTTIGAKAFSEIYNLKSVHIGSGLTNMGEAVFLYSNSIAEITVDAKNTAYCCEDGVLFNGEKTELILYPPAKEQSEYVVPDSVCRIDDYAFYNCSGLTSVVLPEGLETIGDGAFYYCQNLTQADLPSSLTGLGASAFEFTKLTVAVIPDGVTTIGASAFAYAPLTEVTIGSGVTEIETRAFSACTKLETVTFLGDAPEVVGEYAFSSVQATCYYPQNNNTWTSDAMAKFNTGLTWEMITYEVASGTCGDGVSWVLTDNGVLTVSGTGAMAFDSCPWQSFSNQINKVVVEEGVTAIADEAFAFCLNLTEVILADTVVTVGSGAFSCCVSLKTLDLGDGVTDIGAEAFLECVGLECIILPNDGTSLGARAFAYCSNLREIYILGEPRESYDDIDVFTNVMATVYYTDSDWKIFAYGFEGDLYWYEITAYGTCGDDLTWRLSDGVLTVFGTGLMYHYDSAPWDAYKKQITLVNVEEGVTSVGGSAFYNCTALKTVYLADSVKIIAVGAFRDCTALETVNIPANVTAINDNSFRNCDALTDVTIPVGVTSIGEHAFRDCDALSAVSIPEKVSSVGNYAFAYCDKLAEIEFLGDAPSIVSYAFSGVTATAYYPAENETWTSNVRQNYGGTLVWQSNYVDTEVPVVLLLEVEDRICSGFTKIMVDATDNVGVARIKLTCTSKGGETVVSGAPTEFGVYTWDVSNLADGEYTITAVAYDVAGNPSEPATITATVDNIKPVLTTLHVVNADKGSLFGGKYNKAFLSVSGTNLGSSDTVTVSLSVNAITLELNFAADETYELDLSFVEGGTYTFEAAVRDAEGNTNTLNAGVSITVDNTAPPAPNGLYVVAGQLMNTLSWSRSTQTGTVTVIYRALSEDEKRTCIATIVEGDAVYNSYVDSDVIAGTTYYYWVAARDELGNESDASGLVSAVPKPDTTKPEIISIAPINGSTLTGSVTFAVAATDNIQVKSIALACSADGKNWVDIGTEETTGQAKFTVDTTAFDGERLYLKLTVLDIYGNQAEVDTTYSYVVDNTAPEQVTGLTAAVSSTTITLNWEDVAAQDFSYFVVEQLVGETYQQIRTVSDALGVHLTGLNPDTAYTYRVYAVDQCGNKGVPSDSLTATTVADTTAPVVSAISPAPAAYNAIIPMSFTVSDDQGVGSLSVQISYDGSNWTKVAAIDVMKVGTSIRVSYELNTTVLEEGLVYVRAVPTDLSGNVGDSSNKAPYCQYSIDRTAPAAPAGLTAEAGAGKVVLSWKQGSEQDLGTYTVYRSEQEDGAYTVIASGLSQLNWADEGLDYGATYYYRIDVIDQAGNRSEASAAVDCTALQDEMPPIVVSVSPSDGYTLGADTAIQVKVWDNNRVTALYYQVSADGGVTWLDTVSADVNAAEQVVKLPVIQENLDSGFQMKFWCVDAVGQISEAVSRSYELDKAAPAAPEVTAAVSDGEFAVELTWVGGTEDDLAGYRVYRAEQGGNYKLLTQKTGGAEIYTFTDRTVTEGVTYSYYIESVDVRGNTAKGAVCDCVVPENVNILDTEAPVAMIDGSSTGATKYEIMFNAARSMDNVGVTSYQWDFGDGTTSSATQVNHAYQSAGIYTVTLTVSDAAGNTDTQTMTVTIRDPEAMGTLTITVLDENGQAVPGAGVYVNLGYDDMSVVYTEADGTAQVRVTSGSHVIGVYKDGYLPAQKTADVVAGSSAALTISIVEREIVVGELTVERMTLEQIRASGIDVSDPANQDVYEFNIQLTYGTYEYILSGAYNGDGDIVKDPEPIEINEEDEIRLLVARVFPLSFGSGSGSGSESGSGSGSGNDDTEVPMVVILDIPGTASWLKDFFDVRLTVLNQASNEFVLDDCYAHLNVPAGLTLMETNRTTAEPGINMGSIPGQQSATAEWILRGDQAGYYDLTADFSAILRDFNAAVNAQFQTAEPFQVRQGDGLVLEVVVENAIIADTDGAVRVGLRNDHEEPYYLPNVALDEDLVTLVDNFKTNGSLIMEEANMEVLNNGETIWWDYIIPRENWDVLTQRGDEDFYLLDAIVESMGGTTELDWEIEEVMPFSINGDLIVVTRLSSSGAESDISYVNIAKSSLGGGTVPSLAIRTYRQNKVTHAYEPCSMEITIKDEHIIKKGTNADGNEVGEDGITVTTDSEGYYCYKGYSLTDLYNTKSYNIRISASRAKPVEIPVVMRGASVATGLLTVYTYTGSGDELQVLKDVAVTIVEADSTNATGTTDKDGKIVFERVDQGYQEIVITKDGYLPLRELVEVGEESEYSFRLTEDDDPTATRIIQISNSMSDYTKGNQTVIPAGGIKGTIQFCLKSRIAEGETFKCYHYRIVSKDGTVREAKTFTTDTAFWLDLAVLKAGDTLEFAIENTDGEISAYMDSNLVVFEQPDFFNGLVYDLSKIQLGGSIDTSSTFKFDPFATLQELCVTELAAGVEVGDDENEHKAALLAYLNRYVFSSTEISQKFPLTAKYDLSGKLTISVIGGASAETTTTTKSSYGVAGAVRTSSASYAGSIEVSQDGKTGASSDGQIQLDFVFQYLPDKDDWSLTVYLGASATQKLIDKDATFFKVLYVAGEVELKEKIKLEVVQTHVGPGDATKLFDNGLIPDSFSAEGEAKVSGGLALLNKKLASVGLYAKAGLEFQFLPYWSLTAKTALGAEGNVLLWKKEKDLVSGEWEASGDTSVAALAAFALYDLRSNQQERLDVVARANDDGGWQGNLDTEQWITDAYYNADVQLVTLGDGSILAVWCDYTDKAADPVALYWSVYADESWSTPARVDDDGTADLSPSLIATDTGAQLVWVDFTGSVAGMDSLTYAEIEAQAFQMLGVTTASFYGDNWTVTEAYTGGVLAANPKVAAGEDSSVLVTWITNEAALEEATQDDPDSICWALFEADGTVVTTGSVVAPYANIIDLGLGYENGYRMSALAEQENGELRLYSAELIGTTWTELATASNVSGEDAAMTMTDDGVIYTINSGRLYAYENGQVRHLLHSDLLPDTAGNLTCSEIPLGTVLLWTCLRGSDYAVCMSVVDEDGKASHPVVVGYTTDGVFSAPTVAMSESELTILFQRAYIQDDSWRRDVECRTIAAGLDLSLESGQVQHSSHLVPGLALESYIAVDSLGAIGPDEFMVDIYTVKDGVETVIAQETGTSSLNLTIQWTVPEDYAGEEIFLRVEHEDDCNAANDVVALNNLVRELAVSGATYVGRLNGKDVFTVDVENQGLVMSDSTFLSVKVIGAEDVLLEQEIAALDAGAKQTFRLELNALDRTNALSLAFVLAPLTGEGNLANNNEYLILPELEVVASIQTETGTEYFHSLTGAVEAAKENDAIVLLLDVSEPPAAGSMVLDKNLTIVLGNNSLWPNVDLNDYCAEGYKASFDEVEKTWVVSNVTIILNAEFQPANVNGMYFVETSDSIKDGIVFIGAYDISGKMLALQTGSLNMGTAFNFDCPDINSIKVFVLDNYSSPLVSAKVIYAD